MATLVTGGAGYIGANMVFALLDAGREVIVVDDLSTGFREAVPGADRFVKGDVGDKAMMRRLMLESGVTAVLHFAGAVVVSESVRDPLKYYANNTGKTRWSLRSEPLDPLLH